VSEAPKSFHDGRVMLYAGDCLSVLDSLAENSVDAICTDPPYHLTSIVKRFGGENAATAKDYRGVKEGATGAYARASRGFMGKEWDGGDIAFRAETWAKVLRVLKPGGHLVAFSAPKCSHRMVCAIEDAGFEIRDALQWMFGTGFPKSHDVSKAIDKALGAERTKVRVPIDEVRNPKSIDSGHGVDGGDRPWMASAREKGFHEAVSDEAVSDEAVSDEAVEWQGWGTALKPAYEPICLARKPLSEKSVAANVLRWGTGAINIDATRIEHVTVNSGNLAENPHLRSSIKAGKNTSKTSLNIGEREVAVNSLGRWPANVCHDGSEEVLAGFPDTSSGLLQSHHTRSRDKQQNTYGAWADGVGSKFDGAPSYGDSGSAARFFYSAKADATDRAFSKHPTVKPVDLMRWLVRMVTPPGGTVLDLFSGTGTTGHAALLEGFSAILIEREAEYLADIERRMALVFAGDIERASYAKQDSPDALPLFGADNAGGARASDSFTGSSQETQYRANRNDQVVTP
jgi:DNA modification methylase